jgi:hypothetical protein
MPARARRILRKKQVADDRIEEPGRTPGSAESGPLGEPETGEEPGRTPGSAEGERT